MESLLVLLAAEITMPADDSNETRQKAKARPRAVSA
jgi:hypothetical protein